MRRELAPLVTPLLAVVTAGCAWEPGRGFATLESASVVATLEPEPAATLSALEIDVSAVELEGTGPTLEQEQEHTHDEAEAPADESTLSPIVILHVDQTLDWLAGLPVPAARIEPTPELPESDLRRVAVNVTRLRLRMQTADGEVAVALPLELTLWGSLDFDVNQDAPERLALSITIEQSAALLAGVDLSGLPPDSTLTDPADPALQPLLGNLAASVVHADFHQAR